MPDFIPRRIGSVLIIDPEDQYQAQVTEDGELRVAADIDRVGGTEVGEDGLSVVPQISTSASGGPLIHKIVSAASTNAVLIGGAGPKKLIDLVISNAHSGVQVIHFYDTDATPVPGTTPTRFTLCMPAGFCGSIVFGTPKIFELGMGMSITGAATDADATNATADKVHGELSYIEVE